MPALPIRDSISAHARYSRPCSDSGKYGNPRRFLAIELADIGVRPQHARFDVLRILRDQGCELALRLHDGFLVVGDQQRARTLASNDARIGAELHRFGESILVVDFLVTSFCGELHELRHRAPADTLFVDELAQ
jgi:hypothetical protein